MSSGYEKRNINWSLVRAAYDVSQGIKTKEDMDVLRAFFYARRGRAYGFRFKDWGDFEISRQEIGATDGTTEDFQIYKTYSSSGTDFDRIITKPVTGTVRVWVNSVEIDEGSASDEFEVDTTTGIITLGSTHVATSTYPVEVECEFDVPVRFDTDHLDAVHDFYNVESWDSIPLVEVRDIV